MNNYPATPRLFQLAAALAAAGIVGVWQAWQPAICLADRFDSASYSIQFGNFNITAGEKESASYSVTDTVGQTGAGPYGSIGSGNYFVGGGFQYIYPLRDFEFSISSVTIDLGTLLTGSHSSRSHSLTVTTRGAGGYTVYARADHGLRRTGGSYIIPHTTCDAGDCTISHATAWTNQNVAGFGYTMTGQDIPTDFINATYFRPFADKSVSQAKQVVMGSTALALGHTATITYKAGISGTAEAGTYGTVVEFVAVPAY